METVIEHVIEPKVAGPPPRRIRLPLSTNLLLLAAVLLFALFIYGGSRAFLEAWKIAWLAMTGRTVAARVQNVLTEPSPLKNQPARQAGLRYTYTLPFGPDRTPQTGIARLEAPEAGDPQRQPENLPGARQDSAAPPAVPTFHVGDTLPLRCAVWLGQPLVYPWQSPPTGKVIFLMLCGGLVIGISALLLRRILHWRQHRLRLLQQGIATTGTIVHKDARAEDAPRYFIRYGYAAGTELHEREEQVSIEQWKSLEVGQPVTVLYDPERREDASLYVLVGKG